MLDQFSYDEYKQILGVLSKNHENITFSDTLIKKPVCYFILRHDIDFSLSSALDMAYIEAENGIRATYFLLLRSEYYNLLSEKSCILPRQLIELNHEVGLHYDVRTIHKQTDRDFEKILNWEIEILSELSGKKISSISMHNPSLYGGDPFFNTNIFINAYNDCFTKEIAYFSDSCGGWRDNAFNSFVNEEIPCRLQLLIHPFFWVKNPGNRWNRLNNWIEEKVKFFNCRKEEIQKVWNNHTGVKEHDIRISKKIINNNR